MKTLIALSLFLSLLQTQGFAQKDAVKGTFCPAVPIEVRIGFHRTTEQAMFLTLKNLDTRLTIKSAHLGVFAVDPIKLKILKTHSQIFKFAGPVKPGEQGESVVTAEDGFKINGDDFVPARCKNYKADKNDPIRFMPDACIDGQDFLVVLITKIEYTDGSKWVTPKLTEKR